MFKTTREMFFMHCQSLYVAAAATAKSLQSCPTLCDPIDGSPPGSPVPGILQAGALEWVAISFSTVYVMLLNYFYQFHHISLCDYVSFLMYLSHCVKEM